MTLEIEQGWVRIRFGEHPELVLTTEEASALARQIDVAVATAALGEPNQRVALAEREKACANCERVMRITSREGLCSRCHQYQRRTGRLPPKELLRKTVPRGEFCTNCGERRNRKTGGLGLCSRCYTHQQIHGTPWVPSPGTRNRNRTWVQFPISREAYSAAKRAADLRQLGLRDFFQAVVEDAVARKAKRR